MSNNDINTVNVFPMIWMNMREDCDKNDFNKFISTIDQYMWKDLYILFNMYRFNKTNDATHKNINDMLSIIDELSYDFVNTLSIAYINFEGCMNKDAYNDTNFFLINPLQYPNDDINKELKKYRLPIKNQIVEKNDNTTVWANSGDNFTEYHIMYNCTITNLTDPDEVLTMNQNKINSLIHKMKRTHAYDVLTCGDYFIFDFRDDDNVEDEEEKNKE